MPELNTAQLVVRTSASTPAFDVTVAIMLGSIRAHWLLAALALRLDWLGPLVKGNPTLLIHDGNIDRQARRGTGLSRHDLEQAARRTDIVLGRLAYLEPDGSISVIPAEREPVAVDIQVESGVQTVRVRRE